MCTFWFYAHSLAVTQTLSSSVGLKRAGDKDVPSLLSGSTSKLVRVTCQVMLGEIWGVVQPERTLVGEDINKLHSDALKVLDHLSVSLDGLENTMPSTVILDQVGLQQTGAIVIVDGRKALSIEIVLRLLGVADRPTILEQILFLNSRQQLPKRALKNSKSWPRWMHSFRILTLPSQRFIPVYWLCLLKDSFPSTFEEELQFKNGVSQHR